MRRLILALCAYVSTGCSGDEIVPPGQPAPADGAPVSDAAAPDAGPDASTALEFGSASGIDRIVYSAGFARDRLRAHITEVGPGEMEHPPHTHGGSEIFYVLAGTGELTLGPNTEILAAGEAAIFDGMVLHGIRNTGVDNLRYMVIKGQ